MYNFDSYMNVKKVMLFYIYKVHTIYAVKCIEATVYVQYVMYVLKYYSPTVADGKTFVLCLIHLLVQIFFAHVQMFLTVFNIF